MTQQKARVRPSNCEIVVSGVQKKTTSGNALDDARHDDRR